MTKILKDMKVKVEMPPEIVQEAIGHIWQGKAPSNLADLIYTYGDTIYSARPAINIDVLEHEKIHMMQQSEYPGGPDAWWKRYKTDIHWRYLQELEAYQRQYRFVVGKFGKRKAFNYAKYYANDLSGAMYGGLRNQFQALTDIMK